MSRISLENRIAVHELIAEYSFCVDNYRGEDWAALFTEDGCLLGKGIEYRGREAFIRQAQKLKDGPAEYRHVITNVVVEEGSTDEEAVAKAYGTVCDWSNSPARVSIFVEYRFQLKKLGERWKIAEMYVHMPYGV